MAGPIEDQLPEDIHSEESSDEEELSDDIRFEVREILDVRLYNGKVQFLTAWVGDDDGDTWEPISHFPGGVTHEMLKIFRERNLGKWEAVFNL